GAATDGAGAQRLGDALTAEAAGTTRGIAEQAGSDAVARRSERERVVDEGEAAARVPALAHVAQDEDTAAGAEDVTSCALGVEEGRHFDGAAALRIGKRVVELPVPVSVAGVGVVERDQAERIHAGGQVERNGPRIAAAIVEDPRRERRIGGLVDPQRGRVLEVQRDATDAAAGRRAEELAVENGKPAARRPRGGDGEGTAPRRQRRVQLAETDRL